MFSAGNWLVALACGAMLALGAGSALAGEIAVERLTCEYREDPLGLDAVAPRLSWVVTSGERGAKQTAYQILVASTPKLLAADKGDLWDSGKIESGQSVLIPYAGKALGSRQNCHWKVRAWDAAGEPSEWSESGRWSMGLLDAADWTGRYIGLSPDDGDPEFPWLRKTFDLPKKPNRARVYVNALGYYELYVNGRKVDDHVLSPAVSQFSKRSFYITHDVTRHLQPGKNCVALWLGSGWYTEGLPGVIRKGPLVRAQLEVTIGPGEPLCVATDESWKAHPSPFSRIGTWHSGKYGGERYDAQRENGDWNQVGFDDSSWPKAVAVDVPEHTVSAQPAEPNRIRQSFQPTVVKYFGERAWLLDFGTNLSGLFEISFPKLEAGQKITMDYGDRLVGEELDCFSHMDEYTAKGGRDERFRNKFNYHAFRYVRITGLAEPPEARDVTAYLVHTDYDINASFACSNTLLTQIHDMTLYTLRCLSLGGYLVDCPQIERLGYGGDGQASTNTALTMFGLGPMYTGWMGHWRDCQADDGGMPHTAPCPYPAGGGPYWCGFIIAASWHVFEQYGDKRILEENYPAMQKWLGYAESYFREGLLTPWPETSYRAWFLGDWARPERREKEANRSVGLVNNCFMVQCYDWMARIATELGHAQEAETYAAKANALRPLVHAAFYDSERKTYADDYQLDLVYPLLTGVTPEDLRADVLKRLEDDIRVKNQGHLDVGLVGVPLLVEGLMGLDRNDLVFDFTSTDTFPGWGYMLKNGATTTWEHWDAERSHIHNCYNGIGVWFYRGLAGIQPDAPAFEHFVLRPSPVGDVTWVKARQDTVRGAIESAWRIRDGEFTWDILIPANTTATVVVPTSKPDDVTESGKPAKESAGLSLVSVEGGRTVFEAQSGRYSFRARL